MTDFAIKTDYRKFNKTSLGIEDTPPEPQILPLDQNVQLGEELIQKAWRYYSAMQDFRTRRKRARMYLRGDQWGEPVIVNGKQMTEGEYITLQGKTPLKNNKLQQIRKNVIGQWRGNESKPVVQAIQKRDAFAEEMLTNAIYKVYDINNIAELDTRAFDEFTLSGAIVCKVTYEYCKERNHNEIYNGLINVNRWFQDTDVEDVRMHGLKFCGHFMDLERDQVISAFAKTQEDIDRIEAIYTNKNMDSQPNSRAFSSAAVDNISFLTANDASKCRVFEIWQEKLIPVLHCHDTLTGKKISTRRPKEEIDEVNRKRMAEAIAQGVPPEAVPIVYYEKAFEQVWECYFVSPYGHILYQGETPYTHESHPFIVLMYPLIDGEVWGMYEDIIDQQRYINRMIILYDFIISASAKGVLIVDEASIADDFDLDAIAEEWVKYNGVIKMKLKAGAVAPKQVSANSTNVGLQEMIALQMRDLQEISGVHGASQGAEAKSGTAASLYAQQAQNAATNLRDLFETFVNNYKQARDTKIMKLILQYYNEPRSISSSKVSVRAGQTDMFDPDVIRDMEFDLHITQSSDTPVYRQMMETTLVRLLELQAIDVESYLENSSVPFAQNLLESIQKKKAEFAAQQQALAAANPQAVAQPQEAQ
jgi:hypothetical protein